MHINTISSYSSNRLVSESSGRSFDYNSDGDLTVMDGNSFDYDYFHNMKQYRHGNTILTTYGYDANGLRIYKNTIPDSSTSNGPGGTIIYSNGPDGNVFSETYDTSQGKADYIYLNGNLVARVDDPQANGPSQTTILPWLILLLGNSTN